MSARARDAFAVFARPFVGVGVIVVSMVSIRAADVGSFAQTGSMAAPVVAGSAVLLDDGRVLLLGGATGGVPQVYDPVTGSFSAVESFGQIPAKAAAVRLDNGTLLVVGGSNGTTALASAMVLDPATGTATPLDATMMAPRSKPTATLLLDGRVLIAGGRNENGLEASAELFANGTFAPTGSMATPRTGTATRLQDGRVLVVGGKGADGAGSAEIFDPATGRFTPTASPERARRGHQATLLADGRVLVTGGVDEDGTPLGDAELLTVSTPAFRRTRMMRSARAHHRAVALANGTVLLVGGRDAAGPLAIAELFDPNADEFSATEPLITPRSSPTAAPLADGRVLIASGRGGESLTTAELYVDAAGTATTLSSSSRSSTYGDPIEFAAKVTSAAGVPDGIVRFVDDQSHVIATATLDDTGAATAIVTDVPAGDHAITAVYAGARRFRGSESKPVVERVRPARATATMTISPLQRQYSDRVTVDVAVSPPNAAQSVTFRIGTQVLGTEPLVAGKAHATFPLLGSIGAGVKAIVATFNQAQENYQIDDVARSVQVLREDARVGFSGPTTQKTQCSSCGTAIVKLEATVRDISSVAPATDADPGNVGTATVAFINRATGAIIQTVPVVADRANPQVGKATYDWPVNIGSSRSQTFTIGMVVGNQYLRNSTQDDAKVTVTK
jgi:hypothetical protein